VRLHNPAARPRRLALWEAPPADLGAGAPAFRDVRVAARAGQVLAWTLTPRRRGERPLGTFVALVRSPLGLLRRRQVGGEGDALSVYPDVSTLLQRDVLDPRRLLATLGARPTRRRGEGMDFESLRDAVPGDDPRRLDWAASARRGRPVVRVHQHERHHRVTIALDASRLMAARAAGRTKLDHAVDAALALAFAALVCGDRVGLVAFDREVRAALAPRGHRRSFGEFLGAVRDLEPRLVEADYGVLARTLLAHGGRRSLVVLMTDFVEADPGAVVRPLAVLGRHHQLLLAVLRDPVYAELDERPPDRPVDPYRQIALDDLAGERELALTRFRRGGVDTLDVPPDALVAPVLNRYLAARYGPER